MAAICLPGEVRRPVPGCYSPGGALVVLSVGTDASLRPEAADYRRRRGEKSRLRGRRLWGLAEQAFGAQGVIPTQVYEFC